MVAITVRALPKQLEFLESEARSLLYSGAWGAGKSRALCLKLVIRASRKNAREGLIRKHLTSLKATTLRTLLEPEGTLPPVLPKNSYHHNKQDKRISIIGGGEIEYFGMDDPIKIGSRNLSGAGIDEAIELTEEDWLAVRGRIRLDAPGLTRQIYGATNPSTPSHYLARYFGLALDYRCKPGHQAIRTCARDNFFLPKDYLDDIETLEGMSYKRYVLGLWVGSDRLVYDQWDRERFVHAREPYGDAVWRRCVVGGDYGYTNPSVFIVVLEDYDGRIHIAEEWYERQKTEEEIVQAGLEIYNRVLPQPERFEMDPSAAGLIAALKLAGVPAYGAENDVPAGQAAVRNSLVIAGDGRPRQTVDSYCLNTIREYETHENKPGTDKPIDKDNHALDGVRYAKVRLDGGKACGHDSWGEQDRSEVGAEFGDLGESDSYF